MATACSRGEIDPLARLLAESRPLRARLSISGDARPCPETTTAGRLIPIWSCGAAAPLDTPLDTPAAEAEEETVSRGRDVAFQGSRRQALSLLARRPSTRVEDAIEALEAAHDAAPDDAALLTDLAAAYLTRAEVEDAPYEIVRALASLDRALDVAPDLAAALYGRALALEMLHLRDASRQAWHRFLAAESDPAWAADGAAHLARQSEETTADRWPRLRAALESPSLTPERAAVLAAEHPQLARLVVEEVRLRRWAEAENAEARDAEQAIIARIGSALAATSGDRWIASVAAALPRTSAGGDRVEEVAIATRSYAKGRDANREWRLEDANRAFEIAHRAFTASGNPLALSAHLHLGLVAYRLDDLETAATVWQMLDRELSAQPFVALRGHLGWMRGLTRVARGDGLSALDDYRRGLDGFLHAGELDHAVVARTLIAECLNQAGRDREAWRAAHEALAGMDADGSPERYYYAGAILGAMALTQDQTGLALLLKSMATRFVLAEGVPATRADALIWRAWAALRDHRPAAAAADLDRARSEVAAISEPDVHARLSVDLAQVAGYLVLERDPRRAEAYFDEAHTFYRSVGLHAYAAGSALGRSRALRETGDFAGARRDLQIGLEDIAEISAPESLEHGLDIGFGDPLTSLWQELVAIELDGFDDPRQALALHLASLGNRTAGTGTATLDQMLERAPVALGRFAELSASHAVVVYASHPTRLLLWAVDRSGLREFRQLDVSARELSDAVSRFARSIDRGQEPSADLARWLLAPIESTLGEVARLTIVASDSLATVPFAALQAPESGRYLVESHTLSLATGVGGLSTPGREPAGPIAAPRVLVIGDPAFDRSLSEGFEPLPGAAREARAIADLYGVAPLIGQAADVATVLERLAGAEIVHAAAHAVIQQRRPERSTLLLATAPKFPSGMLEARRVAGLDLRACRLVVLSACSSSADSRRRAPALAGIARAFLAAGADAVVGSLWPVSDLPSAELLIRFHRAYQQTGDAAAALRLAQNALLRHADPTLRRPSAWAGFQIIDG